MLLFLSVSFGALLAVTHIGIVHGHPTRTVAIDARAPEASAPPHCFPAIGFTMPATVPSSLTNWWCAYSTEYAFVGFSYEVTECRLFAVIWPPS